MGNYRFKLSDMMPNGWFYKLRDMSSSSNSPHSTTKNKKKKTQPHKTITSSSSSTPNSFPPPPPPKQQLPYHPGRASYYFPSKPEKLSTSPVHPRAFPTHFPTSTESPRKSKKKSRRRHHSPRLLSSSVASAGCSCRTTFSSVWKSEPPLPEEDFPEVYRHQEEEDYYSDKRDYYSDKPITAEHYDLDGSCRNCRVVSSATDIILDIPGKVSSLDTLQRLEKTEDFEHGLPPILTKPPMKEQPVESKSKPIMASKQKNRVPNSSNNNKLEHKNNTFLRKSTSPATQGLRMRTTSPRLASKKIQAASRSRRIAGAPPRKVFSESFAVVKSSSDPQRDFRDSMVEMIVENNLRESKDLEELLACYLSLNSNEYHDVIVKVFEQIWLDLTDVRLRRS